MSDKKWTAGPWGIVNGGTCAIGDTTHYTCEIDPDANSEGYRGSICRVQSCDHIEGAIHIDEAESNASLISAAPDLYDALAAIINDGGNFAMTHETHRKSRAALAKALGEKQ